MKIMLLLLVVTFVGCGGGRRFSEGAAEAAKHPPEMVTCTTIDLGGGMTQVQCR